MNVIRPINKTAASTGHAGESFCPACLLEAPIGYFHSTLDGRYLVANNALARMYGFESAQELVSSTANIATQRYVVPAEREGVLRLLKDQGEVVDHESQRLRRDGSVFWASLNARWVEDSENQFAHIQGFLVDITERRQAAEALRKSEELLRAVLNASPELTTLSTIFGEFVEVNEAFCIASGRARESILGRERTAINLWVDLRRREEFLEILGRDGSVSCFAADMRHSNGAVRQCMLSARALVVGGRPLVLTVAKDVTPECTGA